MPIYEYQCKSCQHELEALQKISDKPLQECPSCGEPALRKKVSAAAFRLKGGGWYETDFKTGDKKNLAGEAKADAGASAKSDAKGSGDAASSGSGDGGKKTAGSSSAGSSSGTSAAAD